MIIFIFLLFGTDHDILCFYLYLRNYDRMRIDKYSNFVLKKRVNPGIIISSLCR